MGAARGYGIMLFVGWQAREKKRAYMVVKNIVLVRKNLYLFILLYMLPATYIYCIASCNFN